MLSAAAITRRFVGASAVAILAGGHYTVAQPTSELSLSLAQGQDSVVLDRRDAFAVTVRAIAARVGVRQPENLTVRVGGETTGASLGANATIGSRGACLVLPIELYDAFYAPRHDSDRDHTIPGLDEINFVLAHECAHIARNHAVISGTFLPASLIASCVAVRRIPYKLLATVVGAFALVGGNLLLSWRLEHEADHIAAEQGFATGGIRCFERKLSRNCELRSLCHSKWITKQGNYLGDTAHPLLTSRIHHLRRIAAPTDADDASCWYCMKMATTSST